MGHVLITYHSNTGSTKEVSESICQRLRANGVTVELKPLSEAENLEGYDHIVIGAPINGFRWVPEAVAFVEANEDLLSRKKTSIFLLSYLIKTGRPFLRRKMAAALDEVVDRVHPVHVGYFGGRVNQGFPTPVRWMFGVEKSSPMDVRDWSEIESWTDMILRDIQ